MNAIEAKQLKKLQDFNKFFSQSRESLGDLLIQYELKKASILNQVIDIQNKYSELEKELKEDYGEDITINIETGEIQEKEVQEVKSE